MIVNEKENCLIYGYSAVMKAINNRNSEEISYKNVLILTVFKKI